MNTSVRRILTRLSYRALRRGLYGFTRLAVGAYPCGALPVNERQTLFFANHTSHLDTLTMLAVLSTHAKVAARPVAARDYWGATAARQWVAEKILRVVFIDRQRVQDADPLEPVHEALRQGSSLIFFPEGTRRDQELPGPFKSGLYHLALAHPQVQLVPVYLENLHRILPKGSWLPVPLINNVCFGEALTLDPCESKESFLARAHALVCNLAPGSDS